MDTTTIEQLPFEYDGLLEALDALSAEQLDLLGFGVIHFDAQGMVLRYNRYEQVHAGLRPATVLGRHVFTEVAQCMNNFMVAECFEGASQAGTALDSTIDYVLTWRMKPTPVKLRMLRGAGQPEGYVLLKRLG